MELSRGDSRLETAMLQRKGNWASINHLSKYVDHEILTSSDLSWKSKETLLAV